MKAVAKRGPGPFQCRQGHNIAGHNKMVTKAGYVRCRQCANDGYNRRYADRTRQQRSLREAAPALLDMVKLIPYFLDCDPECGEMDPTGEPALNGPCRTCRIIEDVKALIARAEGKAE